MEKGHIESLIADYLAGEISPKEEKVLVNEMKRDAILSKEFEELRILWESMNKVKCHENISPSADDAFYLMLENERETQKDQKSKLTESIPLFWQAAAAIIIIVTAFSLSLYKYNTSTIGNKNSTVVKAPPEWSKTLPEPASQAYTIRKKLPKQTVKQSIKGPTLEFASERIEAVRALANAAESDSSAIRRLMIILRDDQNANVRITALDALRPLTDNRHVQKMLIHEMTLQDDEVIRRSIIDVLIQKKSADAIPEMLTMLNKDDLDPLTQQQLQDGVNQLNN